MRKVAVFQLIACMILLNSAFALAQDKVLMMATTTSTEDTGLLPVLAEAFKKKTGVELRWVAVGTGKALEHGKACDVDVLMVHAPEAEKKFMDDGAGQDRTQIMYNDFVLVGPKADPMKVKGKTSAEALKAIAEGKGVFISRGDKSGTHMAELKLWKNAGMETPDKQEWYVSPGQGMLQALRMASEKGGYALTDRGTWIKFEASPEGKGMAIVVEGDKALLNQYSVITLNTAACPKAKHDLARQFAAWIASPEGQKVIADFKVMDKQLFFPNAGK
ncbi:substrate-binding domain-containing protein [Fundidesulfovibrio soli]|uniref:substrate-binding domain-containing protein n=1 Tax=Fundidesulfovibrio soli TaxID=2922716 RepID=UPI001FAF212F|nr:substrate-binding domain-containing protein [Fundidesulfovibrio soli]